MNSENINLKNAATEALDLELLAEKNCKADVLRLDKIHPIISGNKWFKLKYNLEDALAKGYKTLLTFGGAYSNHIIATALAARLSGLNSIGLIRGEESQQLSHTLIAAREYGMHLEFISRSDFKKRTEPEFIQTLKNKYADFYLIPEGGASLVGRIGAEEIIKLTDYKKYSHIMCAIGTGTMFTGIINASDSQKIIGIPVLKGMSNLLAEYSDFINNPEKINNCQIFYDYHLGGYAKKTPELINFMNHFFAETGIPTDFVYTAKLLYAFIDLLKKDFFSEESNILIIHSGGLQGNLSLPENVLTF